jgi:hypothetical protein
MWRSNTCRIPSPEIISEPKETPAEVPPSNEQRNPQNNGVNPYPNLIVEILDMILGTFLYWMYRNPVSPTRKLNEFLAKYQFLHQKKRYTRRQYKSTGRHVRIYLSVNLQVSSSWVPDGRRVGRGRAEGG